MWNRLTHLAWLLALPFALIAAVIAPLSLGACTPDTLPTSTQTSSDSSVSESTPLLSDAPTPTPTGVTSSPTESVQALRVQRLFPQLVFQRLTNLAQPDDGLDHILVTEQAGRILLLPNDQDATDAAIFLDITDRVEDGGIEEGLIGLAFDPGYSVNGYLYVYYSAAAPRRSVLSRFSQSRTDPGVADPDSELIIMEISQPAANHNGGQLAFGPDAYLYVGLGDGGFGGDPLGNGQDVGALLGTILRLDVTGGSDGAAYSIPPDNPFVGVAGAREEVWAYGFRNPWRFSFDVSGTDSGDETGRLWVADVGQNRWEEIDVVEPGLNYGWNVMEGAHCFSPALNCDTSGLQLPVIEYDHSDGCSVTGGYVYWGQAIPSLVGSYLYGDFCSGNIWGLRYDGRTVTHNDMLVDSDLSITSFGEDRAGNLYILSRHQGIYVLTPS